MIEIEQNQVVKNWIGDFDKPMVSIRCLTYNHEKYISQALDGFLMQKTNFPFEIIVHDDASTDKTADIIREYEKKFPNIIKPIYETENQYSKHDGSLSRIVTAAIKGKYVAFCEGDDYWIDENKLQMQIDFLEKNIEYGMTYTNSREYIENKNKYKRVLGKDYINIYNLLQENVIPTQTVCIKADLFKEYQSLGMRDSRKWMMGDYPLWLWFCIKSNIKYIDKVTAIYRVLPSSASHFTDIEKYVSFAKSTNDIRNFYRVNFLNLPEIEFPENYCRGHYEIIYGNRKKGICYLKKSEIKNKKEKFYLKFCENYITYFILVIYYRCKYGI